MKQSAEARWHRDRLAIVKKMESKGISQYALAKESGINRSTIKRILDGNHAPNIVTYYQIIGALANTH